MELKCEKENIISVKYYDLESFIAHSYGLSSFEILESPNDTTHEFTVKKETIDGYDLRYIEEAKRGHLEYWKLLIVLIDLVNKDLIEEGKYLVRVSW